MEHKAPDEIKHLTPQRSGSIHLNLPLVLYNSLGNFFAKFLKAIRKHSVHVRYKTYSRTINSSGNSSISNLGLQGHQQLGTQGFVLLTHT